LPLPKDLYSELNKYKDKDIVLGLRPQDLYDKTAVEWLKIKVPSLRTQVEFSELLGQENYIHMRVGKTKLTARVDTNISKNTGEKFDIFFNLNNMHLFDKSSQVKLI